MEYPGRFDMPWSVRIFSYACPTDTGTKQSEPYSESGIASSNRNIGWGQAISLCIVELKPSEIMGIGSMAGIR